MQLKSIMTTSSDFSRHCVVGIDFSLITSTAESEHGACYQKNTFDFRIPEVLFRLKGIHILYFFCFFFTLSPYVNKDLLCVIINNSSCADTCSGSLEMSHEVKISRNDGEGENQCMVMVLFRSKSDKWCGIKQRMWKLQWGNPSDTEAGGHETKGERCGDCKGKMSWKWK